MGQTKPELPLIKIEFEHRALVFDLTFTLFISITFLIKAQGVLIIQEFRNEREKCKELEKGNDSG